MRAETVWAVVPLKSPAQAKSRLAPVLDSAQRSALSRALAIHVLRSLQQVSRIERIFVVTASDAIAEGVRALGVDVIRQAVDAGTSAAFAAAIAQLPSPHPRCLLMLPGDLPMLNAASIDKLLDAADRGAAVVIAPDRKRVGTNALLCSPPQRLVPRFGEHSFSRHLAEARALGASLAIVDDDSLAFDLDEPADLDELRAMPDCGGSLMSLIVPTLLRPNNAASDCAPERMYG